MDSTSIAVPPELEQKIWEKKELSDDLRAEMKTVIGEAKNRFLQQEKSR